MAAFQKRRCVLLLAALACELRLAHCGESQCDADVDDGKASLLQRTDGSPRRQGKQLDDHRVAKPHRMPFHVQENAMEIDRKIQHEASAGGAAQSASCKMCAQAPSGMHNISTSDLKSQSVALDLILKGIAKGMAPGPTRDLLAKLRLCAPCDNYQRFGELNDGGYIMCTDGLSADLAGAFSYGVDGFGWGSAVASRYHIPVYEYDCGSANFAPPCASCNVTVHDECILASADKPIDKYKTLSQQLEASGLNATKEGSLLLKMDTSGAEWKFFAEEPIENLKKFRQIVVEYHSFAANHSHPLYLQAVNNIERAGFVVTFLQGHDCCNASSFVDPTIPEASIEVTYVRKPAQGCANSTQLPADVKAQVGFFQWLWEMLCSLVSAVASAFS